MSERIQLPRESTPENSHTADYKGDTVDVYRLIRASESLDDTSLPLSSFNEIINNHYWHDSNGDWLGPYHIIEALKKANNVSELVEDENLDIELRKHIQKVLNADYETYPIIMIQEHVIDGVHRITKAFLDSADTIKVKRFEKLPEGSIITDD